jgi:ribonucleotide reductase beta subunit family protein with ferritin-like domain
MRKIVLSLLFLGMMPTVALSLDNQTQEILEKRTCQYLKSGLTLGETTSAISSAVFPYATARVGTGTGSGSEILYILRDEIVRGQTEAILVNAKKRCPEFFPRN